MHHTIKISKSRRFWLFVLVPVKNWGFVRVISVPYVFYYYTFTLSPKNLNYRILSPYRSGISFIKRTPHQHVQYIIVFVLQTRNIRNLRSAVQVLLYVSLKIRVKFTQWIDLLWKLAVRTIYVYDNLVFKWIMSMFILQFIIRA